MTNNLSTWLAVFFAVTFAVTYSSYIFLLAYNEYEYVEENQRYCESMGYDYIGTIKACYKETDEYNSQQNRYTYKKIPDNLSDVS